MILIKYSSDFNFQTASKICGLFAYRPYRDGLFFAICIFYISFVFPLVHRTCTIPYALCPMPYALCPMLYALSRRDPFGCFMPYALCSMLYALRPIHFLHLSKASAPTCFFCAFCAFCGLIYSVVAKFLIPSAVPPESSFPQKQKTPTHGRGLDFIQIWFKILFLQQRIKLFN